MPSAMRSLGVCAVALAQLASCGRGGGGQTRLLPPAAAVSEPVAAAPRDGSRFAVTQQTLVVGAPVELRPAQWRTAATPSDVAIVARPALPAGLAFDPTTGTVSGTPSAPTAGALYELGGAALWLEVIAPPGRDGDRFVAPGGDDAGPGDAARPFATVGRAVADLRPGARVFLRAGTYREAVRLKGVAGTAERPIELRAYPGERAVIDGSIDPFASDPARAWQPSRGPGAVAGEYVSAPQPVNDDRDLVHHGAFIDPGPYRRLLTYSRLEDLRAGNESFARIAAGDRRAGPVAVGKRTEEGERRPWTYFGPGIYFDEETRRVHVRLAPTHNRVEGVGDYAGPSDPRVVPLALSRKADRALELIDAAHIRVVGLGLHHGGRETLHIERSDDVTLDHVEIRATIYGMYVGRSAGVRLLHSRLVGGLPPWSYRSDYKDAYKLEDPRAGTVTNDLVRKTSRSLTIMGPDNRDVEIAYCEIADGHDLYVAGTDTEFHHNWVHDIHDDGIFIGGEHVDRLRVHHNVVERVLAALSMPLGRSQDGARYVYRNLFDLREPTAGWRPGWKDDGEVWRWGFLFKTRKPLPLFFYQNTVLVSRTTTRASVQMFNAIEPGAEVDMPRWFLNNLVVALAPARPFDRPGSFVPPPGYLAARDERGRPYLHADGNVWVRRGSRRAPLYRCVDHAGSCPGDLSSTDALRRGERYGGFERGSREVDDPGFVRQRSAEGPSPGDDLRPAATSPLRGAGVELPPELPGAPRGRGRPDVGAFSVGEPALRVGPDGARAY